jgi:homoserine O-acetyltransferase
LTSYDKLLWSTEEVAMVTDPEYAGGQYTANPKLKAVALLHSMNLTTPQARVEQTPTAGFEKFFTDVEKEGIGQTDANNWRWQIHAMLAQDVGMGLRLESAAAKVKARVLVVNSRQDHMVNPIPAIEFAPMIHAKLLLLEGKCGHLAPGCEAAKVRPAVAEALR